MKNQKAILLRRIRRRIRVLSTPPGVEQAIVPGNFLVPAAPLVPPPPPKVGRPFSASPKRAPSTVGRHAGPCRPRGGPVRGAQSSGGHQPARARFQVHTPALGRSGACRRGRARPQNGAERAAVRLCSAAAHGWRARAGSGAGGGSMRAGGLNLALGAAPLPRWAARGAMRDGHPRRAWGRPQGARAVGGGRAVQDACAPAVGGGLTHGSPCRAFGPCMWGHARTLTRMPGHAPRRWCNMFISGMSGAAAAPRLLDLQRGTHPPPPPQNADMESDQATNAQDRGDDVSGVQK